MATRLTFLCAGATASGRIGAFPSPDEPLDDDGTRKAAALRLRGPKPDRILTSPGRAARETAAAMAYEAMIEPCLADLGFGDWTGRPLADVEARNAPALRAWFADPTAAAPGGESMAALVGRVGGWLDRQASSDRVLLVFSHASVMRAAMCHTLSLPLASVLNIDVAPLSLLELSYRDRWRLQELRRARDA